MPERWRRELERLGSLEPPAGLVDQARARPPGTSRGPSGRSRVVAAVVAFGVFAIAGGFALRAFDRAPSPPAGSEVNELLPALTVTFSSGGSIEPGSRRVDTVIDYGDAHEESFTSTTPDGAIVRWVNVDDLTPFVPGPTGGSEVTMEADGEDPRVLIGPPDAWPGFDRFERIERLPSTPGDYVLVFEADYPEGTARTARRVRLVEPGVLQLAPVFEGAGPDDANASAYLDGEGVTGLRVPVREDDLLGASRPPVDLLMVPPNAPIVVVGDVREARAGLYTIDDTGWNRIGLPIDLL
ncbi:MAG: hypothetical protein WD096_00640, partial [Actinomycetota bacterium]